MSFSRLLAVAPALLVPFALMAQFNSSIEGIVTDSSGGVVPNANVTVTNLSTGVSRKAATSSVGFYRVVDLGPGTYSLVVEHEGFRTSQQNNADVEGSQTVRINVVLEVGSVGEKITVEAKVPKVDTEEGRISGLLTTQDVQSLPLNGQVIYDVIALAPGVSGRGMTSNFASTGTGTANDSYAGENQPEMYANGQRVESNSYLLDDMSANSLARGGVTNLTPNPDSIAQVRVISNNFSAVNGRSSGGQIEMITKSGTNEFHGGATEYFQNNTLADRNEFEGQVPVFRRNEFGGYIGGPILKNRTFFFGSFTAVRQSGTRDQIYAVETQQFANYVEQTAPNSIAAKFFSQAGPAAYPTSGFTTLAIPAPGSGAFIPPAGMAEIGNVSFAPATWRNGQQLNSRIDHELRPGKDTLYGSLYHSWDAYLNGGIRPAFNRADYDSTWFVGLNEIHIFSPNKVNELRADMVRDVGTADFPPNAQFPSLSISGITGNSVGNFPYGWFQTSFNYKDVFSWVHSSHTIKIGGELRRVRGNSHNTASFIPSYSFSNILTFANDNPTSETRLVNPQTGLPVTNVVGLRDWEWALFVNDDWKVSRNLTINIGLRYENYESPTESDGLLRNFVFGSGSSYEQRLATGTMQFHNFFPSGPGNLAPRFGFAWDPKGNGKTAIRGGYGIAYDRLFMTPLLNFRGDPPLHATATLGPVYGTAFTYSLGNPSAPYLGFPIDPALQQGLNAANGITGTRLAVYAVDPNTKSAYTQNWFLGVQHELVGGWVLEANFTGSAGHHLYDVYDVNRFAGDLLANGTFHGFNPYFSNMYMITSGSNSIYMGGTMSVKHSFGRGVTIQGNYTYSKVIDDTDSLTNTAVYEDANNRSLDRGLAGFNVANRLAISGLWQLPFLRSRHGFVGQAFAGWFLSGSEIFQTGFPMTVLNSAFPAGDYNADGTASDRPNAPLSPIQMSGYSRAQFLNGIFPAASFPIPVKGTDGTLGRNIFTGPSFSETDLSLSKKFSFGERAKLEFRMEAFNAFNHVNLSSPSTDLSSSNFGKSTSTLVPRQFQGAVRVTF
jgi:Carboxypeptidase regulatory-like domain